jgi:hypothetical protein
MASCYFCDLPVYRLPEERYYAERDTYIGQIIFPSGSPDESILGQRERRDPKANDRIRDHLQKTYGGCWRFNEVIGQIRLHFLGTQVRGEYFAVVRQRIFRTRTKMLEYQTWKLAPEINIAAPYGNMELPQFTGHFDLLEQGHRLQ